MSATKTAKPLVPLEAAVQIAVIDRLRILGVWTCHLQNEGRIEGTAHQRMIRGARRKAQGVRTGAPDLLCVHRDGRVAWLEVKRPGYRPSDVKPAQVECHEDLRERNQHVAIVTSQDEAVEALRGFGWRI